MVVGARDHPFKTALSALLEDSEKLIADNCRPVPLKVNGVELQIGEDDWLALRETHSMPWLLKHLGHDEENWWLAAEQRHLNWSRVLGLPRFPPGSSNTVLTSRLKAWLKSTKVFLHVGTRKTFEPS